jgi:hypothetical protein
MPAIYLIDDKFYINWPVFGDNVPWYPHGQLILKQGRRWEDILGVARNKLLFLIADHER